VPRQTPISNPFYVLLILVGAVFVVTTFADALMAFRASRAGAVVRDADEHGHASAETAPAGESPRHPLWQLLSKHGNAIILSEVALIIAFAVAAMATDSFWQRRRNKGHSVSAEGAIGP